jgi:hypothetical protein
LSLAEFFWFLFQHQQPYGIIPKTSLIFFNLMKYPG